MHPNSRRRGPDVRMIPSCTFDGVPFTTAVDFSRAIDSGATAKIYKGEIQASQPLVVAVKVFGILNDVQEELLVRELRAASEVSLIHTSILAFLGTADVGQQTAIVSLYMRNGNLMEYIKANKNCDKSQLILQVAEAVDFLHTDKNLVHGDIKSANVLISDFGDALLADFGLSTFIEQNQSALATTTAIRNMNTLRFAAPELLAEPADSSTPQRSKTRESDVYAFGMLVLEVITENLPWHGLTDLAVVLRVSAGQHPPRPMSGPLVSTSHEAWELCLKCWKTDPGERITMVDFLDITMNSTFTIGPYRSIKTFINQEIRSIGYMPDARHIVSVSRNGDIYIWDSRTGLAVAGFMPGHTHTLGPSFVFCVAVSPDGRQLVSSDIDGTIHRWDAAAGTRVGDPITPVKMPQCITYSPNGHYFACGEDSGVSLWTASGREAGKLQSGEGLVTAVAFSPDSARIAVGTKTWDVCIWDIATRVLLSTLPRNCGAVCSLAFSLDGTRLAVARDWGALRIWNFSTANFDLELGERSIATFRWSFSRDGNFLLGLREGVGHIWDARTGQLIGSWPGAPALSGDCMTVSPDGRSMAACDEDGNIVVWDMFA